MEELTAVTFWLDFIGTAAFAVSGAAVGIRRRMDLLGVLTLAVATATAGGMIRDIIMGKFPPQMFRDPFFVALSAGAGALTWVIYGLDGRSRARKGFPEKDAFSSNFTAFFKQFLFWADTLGLAAFTADGMNAGLTGPYGANAFYVIFLGVVTAVGGGMFRDVLAGEVPQILMTDIYASASIIGGIAAWIAIPYLGIWKGDLTGFLLIVAIRFLAYYFHWNLPRIRS